jgi:hypothetical protein
MITLKEAVSTILKALIQMTRMKEKAFKAGMQKIVDNQ